MSFASLLRDPELGCVDLTILRKTWTEEEGIPRLTDLEEIHAEGILHPADPTRLDLLPEESRHDPIVLIHCTEPLSLGERRGSEWTGPDEILCGGKTYRVFQIRPWQAYGFWKAWAVERRDGPFRSRFGNE